MTPSRLHHFPSTRSPTVSAQHWHLPRHAALAVLLLAAAQAGAALPDAGAAAYRRERAACLDGSNPQDRATCLKEADAARAEARRGTLDSGETPEQRQRHAEQRCQAVAQADPDNCLRLARGEGQRSGSVAEGAVIKQITTTTPGAMPAMPAASRPAAPPARPASAPAPQRPMIPAPGHSPASEPMPGR